MVLFSPSGLRRDGKLFGLAPEDGRTQSLLCFAAGVQLRENLLVLSGGLFIAGEAVTGTEDAEK